MFFWNRHQRRKAKKLHYRAPTPSPYFRRLGYEGLERRLLLTSLVVSNLNDSGSGSLRDAISTANLDAKNGVSDQITFGTSGTITLTSGQIELGARGPGSGVITIDGANAITISGNNASRVFRIDSGITAEFNALRIQGGDGVGSLNSGHGGAIYNAGMLTLTNSTFSGNQTPSNRDGGVIFNTNKLTISNSTFTDNSTARHGGAIFNYTGTLTIIDSTFTSNSSANYGGAIYNYTGTLTVSNSTIADNRANQYGGGIYDDKGSTTLFNTIVAANIIEGVGLKGPDVYGTLQASSTNNLIGNGFGMSGIFDGDNGNQVGTNDCPIDPLLGTLGYYGGITETMPLLAGSRAINGGGMLTALTSATDANATSTSITVANAAAIAATPGSNVIIQIDSEQMLVTGVNLGTNTLTVTRGYNGTIAEHSINALVILPFDQLGIARVNAVDIGSFEYQELLDFGFESRVVGAGVFTADVMGSPWTFRGAAGISGNGSSITAGNPDAPEGAQVGYLQQSGSMSVTFYAAACGAYVIGFDAAQSASNQVGAESIYVYVDGVPVSAITPLGIGYFSYALLTCTLAVGNHTITFLGFQSTQDMQDMHDMQEGNATALVDDVSVAPQVASDGQLGDPSFEAVQVGVGPTRFNIGGSAWTFNGTAGVVADGSPFTAANPNSPDGDQVAVLEGTGSISQAVNLASSGTYMLSFEAAQSANNNYQSQCFLVIVDGNVVSSISPSSTNYALYSTASIALGAGNHTITLQGTSYGIASALLDVVNITQVTVSNDQFGDPSFEGVNVGSGFTTQPSDVPWIFSLPSHSNAGIAGNNSAFTSGNPNAPAGTQVAFVQGSNGITQVVNVATDGNYAISFQAAQRGNYNLANQTIQVLVDGAVVGVITPLSTSYASYTTGMFFLTAGNHTITFSGRSPGGVDATAFIDRVNIASAVSTDQIGNSGFESEYVAAGFVAQPSDPAWIYSQANAHGSAGIAGNNSAFTSGNPGAPEGTQVAYLQGAGSISQVVNLTNDGSYAISFQAAQRGNFNQANQTIQVLVDGAVIGTVTPNGKNYTAYQFVTTALAAGNHTITFAGQAFGGIDATAFIDAVGIAAAPVHNDQFGDAGFEAVNVGPGIAPHPSDGAWLFSASAGITGDNSALTSGNPHAPQGVQVGYLQSDGAMTQVVNLTNPGNYAISFQAAQRGNFNQGNQTIQVIVDGTLLGAITPIGTSYMTYRFVTETLAAGNHTITFQGTATADATAFIDQVSIAAAPVANDQFGDAGFEAVNAGSGIIPQPNDGAWLYSGSTGITGNNSPLTNGNAHAPEGMQVGYLQSNGAMTQVVNLTNPGSYAISFQAAQRGNFNQGNQTIQVIVDGTVIGSIVPIGTSYTIYQFVTTALAAGNHTITLQGTATVDATAFIDAVNIAAAPVANDQFADAGFEAVNAGSGIIPQPNDGAWLFSGSAGITGNNSPLTNGNPPAPEGTQVGYLQSNGAMSQVVNLTSAGNYAISFEAAQRGNFNQTNQIIQLIVDGTVVAVITPSSIDYVQYVMSQLALAAGNHTITFAGLAAAGVDATAFIDAVSIA